MIVDAADRYVEANPAACTLFGVPKPQLLDKSVVDFAAPEFTSEASWDEFLRVGHQRGDFLLRRPDGERRVLEYVATANVLPGFHLSVLRDVTEQRAATTARELAERGLRESEARFRAMIEHSAEGIVLIGGDGVILYATSAAARMLGLDAAELIGTPALDTVLPADRPAVERQFRELAKEPGGSRSIELRVLRSDGEVRWIERVVTDLRAQPAVGAFVSNVRDITDRKLAEAALLESDRLYEEAQEVAHLGSWSAGADPDQPIQWSRECARIYGRTLDQAPTLAATPE